MTEEAKKARREYQRKWYHNHPGKAQEYAAKHWEKKAAELKAEKSDK